jgi:hypothetical protein
MRLGLVLFYMDPCLEKRGVEIFIFVFVVAETLLSTLVKFLFVLGQG